MSNRWSAAGAGAGPDLLRSRKPATAAGADGGAGAGPRSMDLAAAGLGEEREAGPVNRPAAPAERAIPGKIPASRPAGPGRDDGSRACRAGGSRPPGRRSAGPGSERLTAGTSPAHPVTGRAADRFIFTKALPFYLYSTNQDIADTAPESYVDPKSTKRIILDVEGAASWYRAPAPAQSGSSPPCVRLGPASSVTWPPSSPSAPLRSGPSSCPSPGKDAC